MTNANVINLVKYQSVNSLIKKTSCHKKLAVLAVNIKASVKSKKAHSVFLKLAAIATKKSNRQRILEKCPEPINKSLFEAIAFEIFVHAGALANKGPMGRVVVQLRKYGYAGTFAKQVSNKVGADRFIKLRAKGLDRITAEYFIYNYGEHLVAQKVYAKVKSLFQAKPAILFPPSVALAA